MTDPSYDPSIFNVDGLERAKWLILNDDGDRTSAQRWEDETEYLLRLMADWMPLNGASVLDWGCGIGRLAKPLIARHGCAVLGVDISQSMRALAVEYVGSPEFLCCDRNAVRPLARFGMKFDCALAVWVLQHVVDVEADVEAIAGMLKPGGRLFILNTVQRFVPALSDGQFQWIEDGVQFWPILDRHLVPLRSECPDEGVIPRPPALWGVFEKPSSD